MAAQTNMEIYCAPVNLTCWYKESPAEELHRVATAMGLGKFTNRYATVFAMHDRILEWGLEVALEVA